MSGFRFAFSALLLSTSLVAFVPASVQAQTGLTPALQEMAGQPLFNAGARPPAIDEVAALSNMVKGGAKLFYMGERSGLHGWFIVKNGQIQMVYLSPDRKSILIGGMFSISGENVTAAQISALTETNEELKAMLGGAAAQQQEIAKAGEPGGAGSLAAAPQEASKAKTEIGGMPAVSLSPGERLMQDLKAAAGVSLGKADAPEIMMVAAPSCPNCKMTWRELRSSVKDNKVQVRIIPVYNSVGGDESRVAAQLLKVSDPLAAWDRYVEGDTMALSGEPGDVAIKAVVGNLNLVTKWNIQGYPYLVYRGKDGRIKIVQGKPERMAAVLADIIR